MEGEYTKTEELKDWAWLFGQFLLVLLAGAVGGIGLAWFLGEIADFYKPQLTPR